MKKVLLVTSIRPVPGYSKTKASFVMNTYQNKLINLGLLPLLVTPVMTKKMVDDLYKEADGVYLTGGGDINPKLYKAKTASETKITEPERDEIELYIAKKMLKDKKPFFGICRGMQILNIAAGGTLNQHLPNFYRSEKHHIDIDKGKIYEDIDTNRHEIKIDETSRAFKIMKRKTVTVNSAHHQGIKKLGKNLRIAGVSPAGVIEIVESKNPEHFCFAVQCHAEIGRNDDMDKLFLEFKKAVNKFKL